jgi:Glycosyl hydrolases family 2, sugar binding domain
LQLPAQGAVFVVLRQAAPETPGRSPIMVESQLGALQGPWKVRFQADRGAPAMADFEQLSDWSQSTDPGVRYFSGRASYAKTLNVRREWLLSERRLILDLGDVHELAAVSVDGREVAVAWHPPYQVDMTSYLDAGPHQIEIAVVNLWANRLIGDKQPGATPVGFAPQSPYQADSSLLPSGLLGPVRLLARDPLR